MDKRNGFFVPKTHPLILGHRGMPRAHQENTMAGIRAALEMGADGVEIDVFSTTDGKVVLFHDEQTERLTGVKGNITEMSWDEVSRLRIRRRLDVGGGEWVDYPREESIPLLEDVLDEFGGRLLINIEMKAYGPDWSRRHTGTEVAQVIRRAGAEASVVVTSFDFFMLYYLERKYPGLHSGFAYDDGMVEGSVGDWLRRIPEIRTELSDAAGNQNDLSFLNWLAEADPVGAIIGSTVVSIEHTLIDSDTVDKFHDKQMLVGAYTLYPADTRFVRGPRKPPEEIAARMAEERVDWVETDDPEQLMNIYARSF
jgi:glycerophosphoryl diester phosphodiesterase